MKVRSASACLVALAVAGCAAMEGVPDNPQAVVDQRVAVMKSFVGALQASGAYASGKGTQGDAQTKLAAARSGLQRLAGLFPRGTALGDKGVTKSRALSTIFANRGDFDGLMADADAGLAALQGAVTRGAAAESGDAISKVKPACVSCHNKYRTADE